VAGILQPRRTNGLGTKFKGNFKDKQRMGDVLLPDWAGAECRGSYPPSAKLRNRRLCRTFETGRQVSDHGIPLNRFFNSIDEALENVGRFCDGRDALRRAS